MEKNHQSIAEYNSNKAKQLSGNTYVSAIMREDLDKYPPRNYRVRLPILQPKDCDHAHTICATWECVECWAVDYRLFFFRTNGGRSIADALRLDHGVHLHANGDIRKLIHEDFMIQD